ncbi:hypothetical protein [Flavobacterium croceum]|uniref:hypothetical protein n=1 Tax=Flavobacterium croceum TaxID=370975 RepID=UPI0024A8CC86|nr:hypothetical protein [Flavobacterium croceum]
MRKILYTLLFIVFISNIATAQVGINTTTPLSTLDINGNLNVKEIGIVNSNVAGSTVFYGGPSGSATPIDDGVYISLTPTSGSDEFILPNAANVPGRIYMLRNVSNSINAKIYSFGGQFFAKDSSTATTSPLSLSATTVTKTIIIVSDGQNWTYFF